MPNSACLRIQIEDSLSSRFTEAVSPRARTKPDQVACGIAALDEMLHGGLPLGVLTEFVGAHGSGRTTAALTYMAAVIQAGAVCAWIDVADALDPESAAACGVDLEGLLWVRCGVRSLDRQPTAMVPQESPSSAQGVASKPSALARHTGGGSPHPRTEAKGMPQAIGVLMSAHGGQHELQSRREQRAIRTPGAPNRPLTHRSENREEQVNSDRLPPRRGDSLALAPRCAEPLPRRTTEPHAGEHLLSSPTGLARSGTHRQKPWDALDQALRTADLLLQGGGFSAIVLDLGSTAPEVSWRIPLATWFRFRAACERTRVSLLLLTQHPCARSSAEMVVRMQAGKFEADGSVMAGIRYRSEIQRSRSHENEARVVPIRKPPQSATAGQWRSEAAWIRTK